jgi:hypothetical protein
MLAGIQMYEWKFLTAAIKMPSPVDKKSEPKLNGG